MTTAGRSASADIGSLSWMKRGAVCVVLIAVWICAWNTAAISEAAPIVLQGRIIDGTGEAPIDAGAVVIVGDRIVSVGAQEDVTIPDGAVVFDLGTATILPGIIDTHVHQAYSERNLSRWAQAGVTTVRDLGADATWDWDALRDELAGDLTLASLCISGPFLTVPNGYTTDHPLGCALPVGSPAEARSATTRLIQQGVDCIKLGIESTYGIRVGMDVMPLAVAEAIVDAAHQRNVPVVAHAMDYADIAVAIEAGVDQLAHIVVGTMPLQAIHTVVDRGIIWIPTLGVLHSGSSNLRRFFEFGGTVALGADDGAMGRPKCVMPIEEFRRMIRSGMDPMSVIVASTRNAALACGIADLVGTLEVGKRADVLAVEGNPLESLDALADALLVMHSGVMIRDERAVAGDD